MEYNAYANVKKILKLRLKKLNYNKMVMSLKQRIKLQTT